MKKFAVTGALGYTGRYITERLTAPDVQVLNLTGHRDRPNPFGDTVRTEPFDFDNPKRLEENLRGVDTLFNTYWIRFDYGRTTYRQAVEDTMTLFGAAEKAGVRRLVHISITNADRSSPLPYFRGKGELEDDIRRRSFSSAILRTTVNFGIEDILINNMAWLLRRFPVYVIPGSGRYRLQPIYVGDLAKLAVDSASGDENLTIDAAGPEIFTFNGLVRLLADTVNSRARILHMPAPAARVLARSVGCVVRDILVTGDEVKGLESELLISDDEPRGWTSLRTWLEENGDTVGMRYASELERHYRHTSKTLER